MRWRLLTCWPGVRQCVPTPLCGRHLSKHALCWRRQQVEVQRLLVRLLLVHCQLKCGWGKGKGKTGKSKGRVKGCLDA